MLNVERGPHKTVDITQYSSVYNYSGPKIPLPFEQIANRLRTMIRHIAIGAVVLSLSGFSQCAVTIASAFAANPSFAVANGRRQSIISSLRAGGNNNNNNDMSELTSTLARLDQQWKIQQRSKKTKSRWSKLILPKDPNQPATEETPGDEEAKAKAKATGTGTGTSTTTTTTDTSEYVYILEPPSQSIPSCVIVFTGGAGLGQFPHIAYNEMLSKISDRLNAVCIAAPYSVGLDHFGLAKQSGERLRRALIYCEDDPARQYPTNIPTYSLSHSLGCKLQTIYMAATQQEFDGIGFMSFNNFSFGKTVSMAKLFADQIRKNTDMGGGGAGAGAGGGFGRAILDNEEIINNIFAFAENIIGVIGVDFTPNAPDTERLIQMRFDDTLQQKTRLFVFDEDNLDNSKEFLENCSGGPGPSASGLPGGHLAPVYFKLGVDDLDLNDVPPEAFEMAQEAMGGFKSASFGNEEALNELVDEVCTWILGKPPSRGPQWESAARNEPPKLLGYDPSEK
jgi:hypothetical protein